MTYPLGTRGCCAPLSTPGRDDPQLSEPEPERKLLGCRGRRQFWSQSEGSWSKIAQSAATRGTQGPRQSDRAEAGVRSQECPGKSGVGGSPPGQATGWSRVSHAPSHKSTHSVSHQVSSVRCQALNPLHWPQAARYENPFISKCIELICVSFCVIHSLFILSSDVYVGLSESLSY